MSRLIVLLLNVLVSAGVSVAVLYYAPGYAPSPKEVIIGINQNTRAITKLSDSTLEVIKRMNEIAPPKKEKK